ncbi:hypothetical protein [Helicobacter sp. T3_23-1056]
MVVRIVKEKEQKFSFGKFDFYGNGKKSNEFEVVVSLVEMSDGSKRFSASGKVWNHIHTDIICGGQMLDNEKLLDLEANNKLFREIKRLWKLYHLNDMHAGTPKQEKALAEEYERTKKRLDYAEACAFLESKGLLIDEHNGVPYKYGTQWLTETIPEEDLKKIYALLELSEEELENGGYLNV